jgi:hypothetical protein
MRDLLRCAGDGIYRRQTFRSFEENFHIDLSLLSSRTCGHLVPTRPAVEVASQHRSDRFVLRLPAAGAIHCLSTSSG